MLECKGMEVEGQVHGEDGTMQAWFQNLALLNISYWSLSKVLPLHASFSSIIQCR